MGSVLPPDYTPFDHNRIIDSDEILEIKAVPASGS